MIPDVSEADKIKVKNLEFTYLDLLTQKKQTTYPYDKQIIETYNAVKSLKQSFDTSYEERFKQTNITSDKYQKGINQEVYLQKEQISKTKILFDKIKSLRTELKKINPKIDDAEEKLSEAYRTVYNWNDVKVKK